MIRMLKTLSKVNLSLGESHFIYIFFGHLLPLIKMIKVDETLKTEI